MYVRSQPLVAYVATTTLVAFCVCCVIFIWCIEANRRDLNKMKPMTNDTCSADGLVRKTLSVRSPRSMPYQAIKHAIGYTDFAQLDSCIKIFSSTGIQLGEKMYALKR
jgi:hypothetical protein